MNEFGCQRCGREARTFPCMSSRRVRVTPKPPSPKSCSQFIVMWGWHAGKRMNGAHSLVTLSRGGQRSSLALRGSSVLLWVTRGRQELNQLGQIWIHVSLKCFTQKLKKRMSKYLKSWHKAQELWRKDANLRGASLFLVGVILMAFHNQVLMKTTVGARYWARHWLSRWREPGGPNGPWVAVDGYRSSLADRTVLTRWADWFRCWKKKRSHFLSNERGVEFLPT